MVKIGFLGLDTSHSEAFAAELDKRDTATISHVWDNGTVRSPEYIDSFCEQTESILVTNPSALVDKVDAAMILTVDWNTHVDLAIPFLEADVPVFIDKPITGRIAAIERLKNAAGSTPIMGGSAVPFSPRLDHFVRGEPNRTLFAAGYNNQFYYRVHLIDTIQYVVDTDWHCVDIIPGSGTTVRIDFENGAQSIIRFDGADDDGTFAFLDVGDETRTAKIPAREEILEELYIGCIDAFLDIVREERNESDHVIAAARLGIAVETVLREQQRVTPDSDAVRETSLESDRFVTEYEPYY